MAVTSLRLALFLICVSATYVSSQKVTAEVSTTSFKLVWKKTGEWKNVVFFPVNVKVEDTDFCQTTIACLMSNTCTFQSDRHCPMFSPCTANIKATVSGNDYTAPTVTVVTAPSPVNNMKVSELNNAKTISWTNPISACFQDPVAQVKYGDYYNYTESLDKYENSLTVPVCMKGNGTVTVKAKGGSGLSDGTSVDITRLQGSDTVRILACPPIGCKDVNVQWEYNSEVCSGVTHYKVTLDTHVFTTTNTSTTETTFEDLELNTQYNTCVHALDKDDKLLARDCTQCTTYPEVVENAKLLNVTDTTAEITWEPPRCPIGGDIDYQVSYMLEGATYTNTTTNTNWLWTNLKPAVAYKFYVRVQHGGKPSNQSTFIDAFTLPSAPENIQVRIYEETSLFITWPAEFLTPNFKYLVSWGDELEHSDYTEYKSYTIDGYNETMGLDLVCVEVETKQPQGLTSTKTCQESPFPDFKQGKPDHTNMIVGVSVSAFLAVVLSVVLVIVARSQQPRRT